MRNESAKRREIHETVTGSAQPYRPGEDDIADPDAVIVEETVPSSPADPPHEPGHADAVTDATPEAARTDATIPPPAGTDRAADRAGLTASTEPTAAAAGPAGNTADAGTTAGPAGASTDTAEAGTTAAPAGVSADTAHLHDRFTAIQSTFVDDPRGSVVAAADLVTEAIETLVSAARERERGLRSEWDRDGADTEDLRNALRDYRGFLDHLATL
jgi:hypothetical protein